MDWAVVIAALSVAGGVVLKTGEELLRRHLTKKEKEREREQDREDKDREREIARQDAHTRELRDAYAEFLAAYGRHLHLAGFFVGHCQIMVDLKNRAAADVLARVGATQREATEAWDNATSTDLNAKIRELETELHTAKHEIHRRAVVAILLENDTTYYDRLDKVVEEQIAMENLSGAALEIYRHQIVARGKALDELTRALSGRFAPRNTSITSAIVATDRKAITDGSK